MLSRVAPAWRLTLPAVLLVIAALIAVFYDTLHSMVLIWRDYETFTHGFFIAPISAWLIWQRRAELAALTPRPSWIGVLAFAGMAFLWLMGELGGAQVVRHYSFIALIPLAVLALTGWAATRVMLAPLLFLLLAVPFGDAFIDPLISWTADFTVAGLQLVGVPVFREGNTLTLPTGVWSVVTACSGVRYLIASITLGLVYAYLTYRSYWRRALFVLAAIVVPIIANGMRAFLIVMIGHLSSMKYATGIDHIIYGWLFFGVVMLLLFWVGNTWREDDLPEPLRESRPAAPLAPPAPGRTVVAALILAALAFAAPAYSGLVTRAMASQPPVSLAGIAPPGWQGTIPFTTWHPQFKSPAAEQLAFLSRLDQSAGLYIGYYRNQTQQSELIASGNVLALPGGEHWRRLDESTRTLKFDDRVLDVHQNVLSNGPDRLLAWYWYWTGDRFTRNSYLAKGLLALNRLLMRPDDGAVIVLFAPYTEKPDVAERALQQVARDALPAIEQRLKETARH